MRENVEMSEIFFDKLRKGCILKKEIDIDKILIKKNKKYYLNKSKCIIDKLMWVFWKSDDVK